MKMATTRTFCCCVPTRLGVVVIAIIGLLGGGALAIAGSLNAHSVPGSKVSIAISIVIYSLLAIVSLLGLIGAIGRVLSLIKLYFVTLVMHLMFSLGIGIYGLYNVFRNGSAFISHCIAANPNAVNPSKVCHEGLKIVKGISVALFIIVWLFEIWGCVIVSGYAKQLRDEKAVEGVVKDTEAW